MCQTDEIEHIIFVRDYNQTYIASSQGKTASCTAGREQAAKALAKNLMRDRPHRVERCFKTSDRQFMVRAI